MNEPNEQLEMIDPSQLDLKMFTHIGDVIFDPVYDESIESSFDSSVELFLGY